MTKYRGYKIEQDGDGFFCDALGIGYDDSEEEVRRQIDDSIADDLAHDPSWPPADTPALDRPWWSER